MKFIPIRGLIKCPMCGSSVKLRKNASKDFQVICPKCGARSSWLRKTDAVIQWYNMVIKYTNDHREDNDK